MPEVMENFEESVRRHRASWDGFASLVKYSTIGTAIILVLMAIFLL
jgi:hypothetical protein